MASYRHYDLVEAHLSSRERTILRRSLTELSDKIKRNPARYKETYDINKDDTVKSHLAGIDNLWTKLNL